MPAEMSYQPSVLVTDEDAVKFRPTYVLPFLGWIQKSRSTVVRDRYDEDATTGERRIRSCSATCRMRAKMKDEQMFTNVVIMLRNNYEHRFGWISSLGLTTRSAAYLTSDEMLGSEERCCDATRR